VVLVNNPFAILYSWKPLELLLAFVLHSIDGGITTLFKFPFFHDNFCMFSIPEYSLSNCYNKYM